jgi:NAD(P)-dependent dehydrogenase (short-subunit alcohol dehydrogenase family)
MPTWGLGAKAVSLQLDTRLTIPGYASMKGAIEILTKYMAKELGARRIAVNIVASGAIETDFGGGAVRNNPEINLRRSLTILLSFPALN